jgi:hypothetical protein
MNTHKETYGLKQAYHKDFTICNENIYFLLCSQETIGFEQFASYAPILGLAIIVPFSL